MLRLSPTSFLFCLSDSISEGVKSRVREEVLHFAVGEGFDVSGDVVFFEDGFLGMVTNNLPCHRKSLGRFNLHPRTLYAHPPREIQKGLTVIPLTP